MRARSSEGKKRSVWAEQELSAAGAGRDKKRQRGEMERNCDRAEQGGYYLKKIANFSVFCGTNAKFELFYTIYLPVRNDLIEKK